MRRVWVLFLLGCTLFWGTVALAQEITLKEALERALVKSPEIKKAELSLLVAQSALREAREDTFSPTVAIGERIGLLGMFQGGFSLQLKDTISFDSSLWEEAKVNLEKAQRALEATREEVTRKVIVSYLRVLQTERELFLAKQNVELYKAKLERLREEYAKGEAASSLLKEAEGKWKEAETIVAHLKTQVRLSKEAFFALLGETMEEDVTFAPLPEFVLSLPEEATLPDFVVLSDTIEDLEGQRRVLEATLSHLRRKECPHIALEGAYAKDDWSFSLAYDFTQKSLDVALEKPFASSGSSSESFGIGLVISWSFSPTLAEKRKQTELQKEMLLLDLEKAKRDVLSDIREKYFAVLKAKGVLESKKMLLEAQGEVFESRRKQFDLGALNSIALLESELGFLVAQKEYEDARCSYLESFLDFLRAIEKPLSWETLFTS